jgi:hypothetical protein
MACEACKTIPPVVSEGYVEKGNWEDVGGLKTCLNPRLTLSLLYRLIRRTDVTGNLSSKKAIVDVYDIFGPAPQTLQGADALATALDILVVVPDFFKGSPMLGEV